MFCKKILLSLVVLLSCFCVANAEPVFASEPIFYTHLYTDRLDVYFKREVSDADIVALITSQKYSDYEIKLNLYTIPAFCNVLHFNENKITAEDLKALLEAEDIVSKVWESFWLEEVHVLPPAAPKPLPIDDDKNENGSKNNQQIPDKKRSEKRWVPPASPKPLPIEDDKNEKVPKNNRPIPDKKRSEKRWVPPAAPKPLPIEDDKNEKGSKNNRPIPDKKSNEERGVPND